MLIAKKIETMASSDWHVCLMGGLGAAIFDLTMNQAKLIQMLSTMV